MSYASWTWSAALGAPFLVAQQNDLRDGAWHVGAAKYADVGGVISSRVKVHPPHAPDLCRQLTEVTQGLPYSIGALPQTNGHQIATKMFGEVLNASIDSILCTARSSVDGPWFEPALCV